MKLFIPLRRILQREKHTDSGFNKALTGFIQGKSETKVFVGYHYDRFTDKFLAVIKSGNTKDLIAKYDCKRMAGEHKSDHPEAQVYLEALLHWPK